MAPKPGSEKGSDNAYRDDDAAEKDRLIGELNRRISVLEKSGDLVRNAPIAIYEVDFHGPRFKSVNDHMCLTLGYTREELLAMNPFDLLDEESKTRFRDRIQKQLSGEKIDDLVEYKGFAKDGRALYWALSVAFTGAGGGPGGAIVVAHDITGRRQAEEALRESEEKFHILADSANTGILLVQGEDIVYINEALAAMGGYTVDECQHLKYWDVMPPDMREYIRWAGNARQRGWIGPSRSELRMVRKDGEEIWLDCTWAVPMLGGKPAVIVMCVDITERKRAEEALRKSEMNLERARRVAALGSWEWDLKTNSLTGPEEYYRMFGIENMEPLTFERFARVIHPDDRQWMEEAARDVRQNRLPSSYEFRISLPGNVIKHIQAFINLTVDEDGSPVKAFGTMHDITERKRIEEALRESEAKFRQMAENINSVFWISDTSGTAEWKYAYMSPAFEHIFGVPVERIYDDSHHWIKMIHPDDRERFTIAMKKRADGEYDNIDVPDFRIIRPDGTVRWIKARLYPIKGEDGTVSRFAGIADDVTDRKRAEDALKMSEANLERAQQIAALGNWEWDLKTNTLTGSKEYYRILGVEPTGPVPFERFVSLVHPDDRQWVDAAAGNVCLENKPSSHVFRLLLPGNLIKYIRSMADVVGDEAGRPAKVFGTMQDITESKRTEEELRTAKQQAELYLDLLGHDINNMHQIALGYLELARGMLPGIQQDEMIAKPIEVLQRSTQLIKNVRKLQRLQDSMLQTHKVDVSGILANVQREFGAIPGKTVALNLNGHEYCPVRANELLHDVFSNLVSNAIKHTGDRADININLDIVNDKGRCCLVSVEDDGPGIPDDFKGRIFNRMLKGTTHAKGMGLGLYLVRSLVDSYGGKVWVEDRVKGDYTKGARFVVLLPALDR